MAAQVVSFINLKGGVGKSTLALAIGEALAFLAPRDRVLLVDIDLQSNLSYATTSADRIKELEGAGRTVYNMFAQALEGKSWDLRSSINRECSNIVRNTHLHNLVCSPALGELDEDMLTMLENGTKLNVSFREILKGHLDQVRDDYDYIFIDCPPSLSPVTSNAIVASDYFVVPLIPEELSLQGIELIQNRIAMLQSAFPYVKIDFLGSILNKVDIRRRWDHLRLAEDVATRSASRYRPFDYWVGDWKPLYTVTDFGYFRSEGLANGWPSWGRKYGRSTRRTNPNDETGGQHIIWPTGEAKTFYIRRRLLGLVNEFIGRLP
ncbi:MAG: AAA family ATPase [Chloroflexi bacterium]|nr:AAA family ATPase [Chloroflexota bacterium]